MGQMDGEREARCVCDSVIRHMVIMMTLSIIHNTWPSAEVSCGLPAVYMPCTLPQCAMPSASWAKVLSAMLLATADMSRMLNDHAECCVHHATTLLCSVLWCAGVGSVQP